MISNKEIPRRTDPPDPNKKERGQEAKKPQLSTRPRDKGSQENQEICGEYLRCRRAYRLTSP